LRHPVLLSGAQTALLSCRADVLRIGKTAPGAMHAGSIWPRKDGGWVTIFRRDTVAVD